MVGVKDNAVLSLVFNKRNEYGYVPLRHGCDSLYQFITDSYGLSIHNAKQRRYAIANRLIVNGFLHWDKIADIVFLTAKGLEVVDGKKE